MAAKRATEDGRDDSIPDEKSTDLSRVPEVIDDTDIIKVIYQIDTELVPVQHPKELREIRKHFDLTTSCVINLTTGCALTTKLQCSAI